jgi:hypothetical protein
MLAAAVVETAMAAGGTEETGASADGSAAQAAREKKIRSVVMRGVYQNKVPSRRGLGLFWVLTIFAFLLYS